MLIFFKYFVYIIDFWSFFIVCKIDDLIILGVFCIIGFVDLFKVNKLILILIVLLIFILFFIFLVIDKGILYSISEILLDLFKLLNLLLLIIIVLVL